MMEENIFMEERAKTEKIAKMEERAYSYWLNSIPGIGNRKAEQLLEVFGTPRHIYETKENEYRELLPEELSKRLDDAKKSWDIAGEYESLIKKGISYADKYAPEYPGRLLDIPDAPLGIFYIGQLPADHILTVAVIGARECSEYGKYVAEELGHFLGEHGVQVISGMARGIDGLSQRAALESGGISFGVLGSGVDVCYPPQNRRLYQKLVERGGVLSSYAPGTQPKANLFPPRNRIVSGLADALVVIEARQKSGTLITVDMALEQGKEVYAVPGRVTDRLSDGCNKLLKHGAGVFLSPADFLEELERSFPQKQLLTAASEKSSQDMGAADKTKKDSSPDSKDRESNKLYQKVQKQLDFYPKSTEQIFAALSKQLDFSVVRDMLMRLCIEGKAMIVGNGYFQIRS
ncbi:MAG: DNA-processing protein DprA [Lachnospiraceae bacterium]|jgi:DNA processing protein|nr:DNA-processing protein DprA [Lachnospiraceae bacterium]